MLAFATMALALPGGMLLALMRMSRLAPVRAFATGFGRILPDYAHHPAGLLGVSIFFRS